MKKSKLIILIIAIILIISTVFILIRKSTTTELYSIKSEKQLKKIYYGQSINEESGLLMNILTMPISFFAETWDEIRPVTYSNRFDMVEITEETGTIGLDTIDSIAQNIKSDYSSASDKHVSSQKDYSTTNIQVENVDEADITKTDGNYIYSISETQVIITDVMNPTDIKIASRINVSEGIPEDLMLFEDKLAIISSSATTYNKNTIVTIYDIQDKEDPKLIKGYTLYEPYYTSRCINGRLYVIASGKLREENDEIVTYYREDNHKKDLDLNNIKYLKEIETNNQTLISMLDLNNPTENVRLNSYLIDISNAYVSEKNIYLLHDEYDYNNDVPPVKTLFGLAGAMGPFIYEYKYDYDYGYKTTIYKFNLLDNGEIKYDTKTKVDGETINQFSLDEYNGNLRVALHSYKGSRVVVFNENLKKIGESEYLAPGEKMYSSRFIGDRAYLVTYRTTDPLYVIDLSNPQKVEVLGELKIPGYSTYLHPYDKNHLIGIGMETKENVNRDSNGRVISTTASIIGMKMALFDVTDVNNPKQISNIVIGDSRATSAILTNHKALLFSKEKELIAIPVNNYQEDFEIKNTSNQYSSIISSFTNYSKPYISEGYFVYKVNLDDGFELKGIINHEKTMKKYSYYNNSKLLRGLYIDNNLYTISEELIKVNRIDNLELISQLQIQEPIEETTIINNVPLNLWD